jgi:hypothetical protein
MSQTASAFMHRLVRAVRLATLALMVATVAACGRDDDGSNTVPAEPTVSSSSASGALRLAWTAVAGATSYRIQKRLDGGAWQDDGSPLGPSVLTAERALPESEWARASYRVQACNAAGCGASAEVAPLSVMANSLRYLKASNTGAEDTFGRAVAVSADGSTLAVGAPFEDSGERGTAGTGNDESARNSGAVYVFVRIAGAWSQQAYLKPLDTRYEDRFGASLALSADGSLLAVGAPLENSKETGPDGTGTDNASWDSGAVYVFERSGTTWSQQGSVKASNTGRWDRFGWSVALSGDGATLAVGATGEDSSDAGNGADNSASASGAVYVFERSGAAWTQQAYLKASNIGVADAFGSSVALSADGGTLAVGAPFEASSETGTTGTGSDNGAPNSGAVYVFERSGATWSQQAYLKASNTGAGDLFGTSVGLSADGNLLAVGAPKEDSSETGTAGTGSDEGAKDSGAVYLFARDGGVWSQQAYLKASNTGTNDQFGATVALAADGDLLAVGAALEDGSGTGLSASGSDNDAPDSGAVYVFRRSAAAWAQRSYLKATNAGADDGFGAGIGLSADGALLAVGAPFEGSSDTGVTGTGANDAAKNSGAVYLF